MADMTQADLETQLAEVENQIAQMTGAPGFSIGGLTVDESKLYGDLTSQRSDLQWRVSNMRAGGGANDNCRASSFSME